MNLHVVSEKNRKAGLWQGYSGTTCVPDCTHLVIASCTSEEVFFSAPLLRASFRLLQLHLFVILTLGDVFTLPKWLMSLTPEDAKGDRERHVRHVRLLRASHSQGPY